MRHRTMGAMTLLSIKNKSWEWGKIKALNLSKSSKNITKETDLHYYVYDLFCLGSPGKSCL